MSWRSLSVVAFDTETTGLASDSRILAIAFYVIVYTMMLKRTTPQNIVSTAPVRMTSST